MKQLVLFNCEWFDAVMNRGVKIHKQYGIVEVRHTRRYSKYDPFILAKNAIQVYYLPYPKKIRDKVDWWVVIKTKPRGTVDDRYTLEVAYQDDMGDANFVTTGEPLENLRDEEGDFEEIEEDREGQVNRNSNISEEEDEVETDVGEDEEEDEFDFDNDTENDNENIDQYELFEDDDDD